MQIKTRAKFVSAILDFYHGPKLWIPDACERVHIFALNAPGLNLEAPSSKIDDFLHCARPLLYNTRSSIKTQARPHDTMHDLSVGTGEESQAHYRVQTATII